MNRTVLHASLLAGTVLLALSGCASRSASSLFIMQNPETMDFVECRLDSWATAAAYEKNASCVEELKKQGYIVWAER